MNTVKLKDEYCKINRGNTVKLTDQYSISPLYHLFPSDFHKINIVKSQDEYCKINKGNTAKLIDQINSSLQRKNKWEKVNTKKKTITT